MKRSLLVLSAFAAALAAPPAHAVWTDSTTESVRATAAATAVSPAAANSLTSDWHLARIRESGPSWVQFTQKGTTTPKKK
jgi:hypothetical protein